MKQETKDKAAKVSRHPLTTVVLAFIPVISLFIKWQHDKDIQEHQIRILAQSDVALEGKQDEESNEDEGTISALVGQIRDMQEHIAELDKSLTDHEDNSQENMLRLQLKMELLHSSDRRISSEVIEERIEDEIDETDTKRKASRPQAPVVKRHEGRTKYILQESKSQIAKCAVFAYREPVRAKYQQQAKLPALPEAPPKPPGRINIQFTIAKSGAVLSAIVTGTDDPSLKSCVANKVKDLKFDPSSEIDIIDYPFYFN